MSKSFEEDKLQIVQVNDDDEAEKAVYEESLDNDVIQDGMLAGVFNVKKPRDFKNSLGHASGNIAKGFGIGIGALFVAPVEGARSEGVTGFFKGLGAGLGTAVVAPLVGVGTGVTQIVRGAAAQADAGSAENAGKVWDRVNRVWVDEERVTLEELLDKEQKVLQDGQAQSSPGGKKRTGTVKETQLYEVLGVPPDASSGQIRKAYFHLAKELHPDKQAHGVTEETKKRFQDVSDAYNILSNDDLRAKYDETGSTTSGKNMFGDIDPAEIFNLFFGAEELQPFIGDLVVSSIIGTVITSGGDANLSNTDEPAQNIRKIKIAIHLRDLIMEHSDLLYYAHLMMSKKETKEEQEEIEQLMKIIVERSPSVLNNFSLKTGKSRSRKKMKNETWSAKMKKIGNELCSNIFGSKYLTSIAFAYSVGSEDFVSHKQMLKHTFDFKTASNYIGIAKLGYRLYSSYSDISALQAQLDKLNDNEHLLTMQPNEVQANMDKIIELQAKIAEKEPALRDAVIKLAMNVNVIDVESTVAEAVKLVCTDTSVSRDERRFRADAIAELGEIFESVVKEQRSIKKADAGSASIDYEQYLNDVLIKAHQRADQEE